MNWRKIKFVTFLFVIVLILLSKSTHVVYADTSPYRSAGWVATNGNPAYSSISGCQVSNDGQYCSRPGGSSFANLFFGSFGQLEDFGIPINSTIDKLRIRIKGKTSANHTLSVVQGYNKINFASVCQIPSDSIRFFLGSIESTIVKELAITSANGLANCVTLNNVNFNNLTFLFRDYLSFSWSADIDNFEIAFDYTPPAVTPIPVVFPESQNGIVWEIGPDKSNLSQKEGLDRVVSIAMGGNFSVALKDDGTVWTWTNNDPTLKQVKGEGGGGFLLDVKKIVAGNSFGMALKNDGSVWEWSQAGSEPQNPTPVKLGGINMTGGIDIAAGSRHKLVLRSDKKVYGWGLNNDGQIGIGCFLYNCSFVNSPTQTHKIDNIKAISAGWGHSLALKNDGTVWGWGESAHLELGEKIQQNGSPGFSERPLPLQITELSNIESLSSKGYYNLALNSAGEVIEWGNFVVAVPRKISEILDATAVSAGPSGFSFGVTGHIIKSDRTLWELYINDIPPKQVPVLKDVVAVASGDGTPSLAVVNSTGDVLGDSTVAPFLDLPWDYKKPDSKGKVMSFSKAALAINSYFDHSFPLLGSSIAEPATASANTTSFRNIDEASGYSGHNGYDWGSGARVNDGDDVLAAASGTASAVLESNSGGAGNVIKIDHGNGFETWYEHLYEDELIASKAGETKEVEKGEKIGKAGHTGNCYSINSKGQREYNKPSCAHIHFSVFQDKDGNKSFSDNFPDGVTDPFGWMSTFDKSERQEDPWENFAFKIGNVDKKGNKSNYLWIDKIDGLKEVLTAAGGIFTTGDFTFNIPSDNSIEGLTFHTSAEPPAKISDSLASLGEIVKVILKDPSGALVTILTKPMLVTFDLTSIDLLRFKPATMSIYSSTDRVHWKKEETFVDFLNNKATAEIDHLTYFALLAERADTTAPATSVDAKGQKGEGNWFRSDVDLSISAVDNEGGLGVKNTYYKIGENDWQKYTIPLINSDEGKYIVSFYSEDNDNNIEDIKTAEFQIDKTPPATPAGVSGTEGDSGWFVSDVSVKLTGEDSNSGISKTEYSLDGGETFVDYLNEFSISAEGILEILYRSIDKAGNIEEVKKLIVKIDKTPPSTVVYASGQRGEENWYRSDVEIGLNGDDEISGYETSYYSLDGENYSEYFDPVIFKDEGEHTVFYYSVDNAGNEEEKKSFEVRIDKTAPQVLISANPSKLWPANGKLVEVKILGGFDEDNIFKISFKVTDEYNLIKPALTGFNQAIKLEAKRNGNDSDGRVYAIEADASDFAGNTDSEKTYVIVPHDQRN